jgi:thiamine biosynthesis protein ThiS
VSTKVPIEIVVNGNSKTVAQGMTISALLREMDLDPARVAVELDRRIVKRHDWDTTGLTGGAVLEVVQFVGGG